MTSQLHPLKWNDPLITLLDQRLLPGKVEYFDCASTEDIRGAILTLAVRGAPLIGIAAAYGMVLAWRESCIDTDIKNQWLLILEKKARHLVSVRPTAINLSWAVDRMYQKAQTGIKNKLSAEEIDSLLVAEAKQIEAEDIILNDRIGTFGAELFTNPVSILTHCNAGALATAGIGTALGVIRKLHAKGDLRHVFIDETRPLLQGARLTATELQEENIPCTLICDNMAATVLRDKNVDAIIVGADRICINGDTANKIGTYGLAVLAAYHQVPLYVAAPFSTFDFSLQSGAEIEIEERNGDEVRYWASYQTAPADVDVYNPAFDVTPASLIAGIITEKGVLAPPFTSSIAQFRKEILS